MCFSTDPGEHSISRHDATCLVAEIGALSAQRDKIAQQLRYMCECAEFGIRPETARAREVLLEAVP
jgi:hypothetical protein